MVRTSGKDQSFSLDKRYTRRATYPLQRRGFCQFYELRALATRKPTLPSEVYSEIFRRQERGRNYLENPM